MPNFANLKSSIYRNINKNIPKDVENLSDLPEESEYYQTISGGNFLIYKNDHIVIFMSPNQVNLFYENNQHAFIDGTFAPKCNTKL